MIRKDRTMSSADDQVLANAGVHGDGGRQVDPMGVDAGGTGPPRGSKQGRFRRWLLPSLGVLFMAICVQRNGWSGWWEGFGVKLIRDYLSRGDLLLSKFVPDGDVVFDGEILFKAHDVNKDGFLSLEEFRPLASRLMTLNDTITYDRNITEEEEVVTIEVKFQPLKLETMTKDLSQRNDDFDFLHGLKHWTSPQKPWQNFGVQDFVHFLPKDYVLPGSLGQVYWLIEGSKKKGPSRSNKRYMPPELELEPEIMVHRFLSLFHPLPFVHMRFAPNGATAVIRAYNDIYVDVVFRIHAEFQLNLPPYFPFWFSPAQFTGHVTIARDASHLIDFHLYVPNDKRLNVDMEWITNPEDTGHMEVDIGYMPQMELSSTGESLPAFQDGVDRRDLFIASDRSGLKTDIVWSEEISFTEAQKRLEVEMFPFKQITYYNFTDGLREATRLNQPLHSIILWGCLDDQSC